MFANLRKLIENYENSCDFNSLYFALKEVLQTVVSDQELILKISSNSYEHQLGFDKFTLYTFDDEYSLRLHYWYNPINVKEDIHSHCADFKSVIMQGSFVNNIFTLNKGIDNKVFSYHFDNQLKKTVAKEKDLSDYKFINSKLLKTHDHYYQSSQVLHNINNISPNTITLSLWAKREYPALVLKKIDALPQDCNCSDIFTSNQVAERINFFLRNF